MVYDIGGGKTVKNVPVPEPDRKRFSISDEHILKLARWACIIEGIHFILIIDHYTEINKRDCPIVNGLSMDFERSCILFKLVLKQSYPEDLQVLFSVHSI